MQLYRGDSIPISAGDSSKRGRTFAEHFLSNGLIAKFSDGGSSRLLEGKNLVDLVLAHVGYEHGEPEQALAYRSPLLSFSEDEQTALNFITVRNKKNISLKECDFEEASHFVWKLSFELPHEFQTGAYDLRYKADSTNCVKAASDQLNRALLRPAFSGDLTGISEGVINYLSVKLADQDNSEHRALLINVTKFIGAIDLHDKEVRHVQNTLERASRDKEWLLYPCDPMPDGFGVSGHFLMNKHLSIHKCFLATKRSDA